MVRECIYRTADMNLKKASETHPYHMIHIKINLDEATDNLIPGKDKVVPVLN
jgi:hypothetical protein